MIANILGIMGFVSTLFRRIAASALVFFLFLPTPGFAWGNEGHRIVNLLAAQTLPADVPAFLRSGAAVAEIEYLGPEPDRWRAYNEPELNDVQAPEHFICLEPADALGLLPHKRLDFEAAVFAHGQRPETIGLQPWQTTEVWERLKAALREYRKISAAKPVNENDLHSVEQAAIFYAGWLGHYVGDGAQPLHATINHDGWTFKDNPHGYITRPGIHWRFEGTFVDASIRPADVAPKVAAPKLVAGDIFDAYVAYLRHSATMVEQVYALDKQSGFVNGGTPESRAFTEERLAAGAGMLRDMIYTAWQESAEPARERF